MGKLGWASEIRKQRRSEKIGKLGWASELRKQRRSTDIGKLIKVAQIERFADIGKRSRTFEMGKRSR